MAIPVHNFRNRNKSKTPVIASRHFLLRRATIWRSWVGMKDFRLAYVENYALQFSVQFLVLPMVANILRSCVTGLMQMSVYDLPNNIPYLLS
jgi:hypothetical protein